MKNMISYYELLGLIEENEQPKRVKICNNIFVWSGCNYCMEWMNGVHHTEKEDEEDICIPDYLNETEMFDKVIEVL